MDNCIFCKILKGEIPSTKIFESENVVAFLDVNPMEKGHTLVVPRRHWPSLVEAPVAEAADVMAYGELMQAVRLIAKAAVRAGADGVNILQCNGESAGQTVGHLHFHVIPRHAGGPVPPAFESGAARYADDAEREAVAAKLRKAVDAVRAEEGVL